MKNMKRVFTLILALALVLSMAVSVSAVQTVDVQTDGHVYNVYQIFSGTQTAADATLTDIEWGTGLVTYDEKGNVTASKVDDFLTALKADKTVGGYFTECTTADSVADVLAKYYTNETVKNVFANIVVNHLLKPIMNGENELEIKDETKTVDLDPGYYLFLDVTENLEQGHAYNPALLQVTKAGNIIPEEKTSSRGGKVN